MNKPSPSKQLHVIVSSGSPVRVHGAGDVFSLNDDAVGQADPVVILTERRRLTQWRHGRETAAETSWVHRKNKQHTHRKTFRWGRTRSCPVLRADMTTLQTYRLVRRWERRESIELLPALPRQSPEQRCERPEYQCRSCDHQLSRQSLYCKTGGRLRADSSSTLYGEPLADNESKKKNTKTKAVREPTASWLSW